MDTDPPPLTSFLLVGLSLCGTVAGQTCNITVKAHIENPPGFSPVPVVTDTEIAVGPESVLACSNSYFTILQKVNGGELARAEIGNHPNPVPANPFFLTNPIHTQSSIGDPVVYYDCHSERFWIVAVEVRTNIIGGIFFPVYGHFRIAVSTSSAPLLDADSWLQFDFKVYENTVGGVYNPNGPFTPPSATEPAILSHNEMIAADQHSLYITSYEQVFYDENNPNNQNRTGTIYVFDKASLLANQLPNPQVFKPWNAHNRDTWGELVAVEHMHWNNSHPAYTIVTGNPPTVAGTAQDEILIGALTRDPFTGNYTFAEKSVTSADGLPAWNNPPTKVNTPDPAHQMDLIAGRFLHASYVPDDSVNSGRIYATHHIQNPTDPTRSIVRWYVFATNGWPMTASAQPNIVQWGDIKDTGNEGLSYYDPSIAVDAIRHVGLVWTQCGEELLPEFWMGSRRPSDPAGTIPFRSLRASQTSLVMQIDGNKADYSGCEPDPAMMCRFWGHSPLVRDLGSSSNMWETHVSSVCVPCEPATTDFAGEPADLNCDGVTDVLDLAVFNALYTAGNPAVDFDATGTVDGFGVLYYTNLMQK